MGSRSQRGRNKAPRTAEHKRRKCVVSHRSGGQKSEVKVPPGAGSFRDHEGGPGPASLAAGGLPLLLPPPRLSAFVFTRYFPWARIISRCPLCVRTPVVLD